ncbi:hypothetical protein GGF46_003730 [Coemansia sp. RSA 552]|nr:hypothetical protein GGF46_003730 [Coemansia sp. RSA 552]
MMMWYYVPVLCTVLGTYTWAAPAPQVSADATESASSESTSDPSHDSNSSDGGYGMGAKQIYYILAIAACALGALVFILIYVYRRRRRMRRSAPANGMPSSGSEGSEHRTPPHPYPTKQRIVLTKSQFNLLPHTVADGPPPPVDAKAGGNADDDVPLAFLQQESTQDPGSDDDMPLARPRSDGSATPEAAAADGALEEPDTCSICLCDIIQGERLVLLVPCKHIYHISCARRWLTEKSTLCPLCKADMLEGLGLKAPKPADDGSDEIELVALPAASPTPSNQPSEPMSAPVEPPPARLSRRSQLA